MDASRLNLNFTSPDYTRGSQSIPALHMAASRDSSGTVHITLVNIDPAKAISLRTLLPGISFQTVTGQILTSPKVTDINTFENPDNVKIAPFTGARKSGEELRVELPAKAVVVLELR